MIADHREVLDQLQHSTVPAEPGERRLVEFLAKQLNKDYHIFFQPFLNGDRPDVIVVLEGYGAIIFEVKDWDLTNYRLDERRHWILTYTGSATLHWRG